MKLYRYRSANINTFSEILNRCAWHSRLDKLNDPFEGIYVNRSNLTDIDNLIEQLKVCCFSTDHENLLLWAHYSDNHEGVCLEYDLTDDEFRGQFFKVKYSNHQPVLNDIKYFPKGHPSEGFLHININDKSASVFLTKSLDWEYEQEWRKFRISDNNAVGEIAEVPGRLSAVYFGLRASKATKQIIHKLLPKPIDIDLWESSLEAGSYKLTFSKYSID
ncbi:DUF2971 domain-containing protein [Leucothrix mucor]|uniref:DUF2971 domain-containing protein n=1 Tax=Leucothrix mucor TaxID=45248 RepID=UPI00146E1006|nr:DUF2971 domain-containing protein [Leucothrix mucor]